MIQIDYCFHSTHKDLPLQKILSACDALTGLGLAVVVPSQGENDYAKAELKKFIYECGRTFGVLQYDQESPRKAIAKSVCAELGGLSVRAAPKAHPQASGSVGQMQRTLYSQLRTLLYQIDQNTRLSIDSNHALYPWADKHLQWLLNRYLVHSDGTTSYFRRWNRNCDGGLRYFGEVIQAKFPLQKSSRKSDPHWETALWLGKDTEADEIIVGTSQGVHKVRTVKRNSPSQQWKAELASSLRAVPWLPKASAISEGLQTTEFVLPESLSITGRVRPPPGLSKPESSGKTQIGSTAPAAEAATSSAGIPPPVALPDIPPDDKMTDLPDFGAKHGIEESVEASEAKQARIDPDAPIVESSTKAQRISSVVSWIAAAVGVPSARTKEGIDVPVEVNYDSEEYREELKLSEPIIWDLSREFPEDAQRIGMDREMNSMREFNVYTEGGSSRGCTPIPLEGALQISRACTPRCVLKRRPQPRPPPRPGVPPVRRHPATLRRTLPCSVLPRRALPPPRPAMPRPVSPSMLNSVQILCSLECSCCICLQCARVGWFGGAGWLC